MIKLKRNVVMFTILTVGAVYFLYEDLRKLFTPALPESEEVNSQLQQMSESAKYEPTGHVGRKLLVLNSNLNEDSGELNTDLNPIIREKLDNYENMKGIYKSFISYNKPGGNRMKKLSRRKRESRRSDFGWKLSLNVTNDKSPKGASNLSSENDLLSKSGKANLLNMAVQMEGASPDDSFKELHQAWDSLGLLLRRLYGKNAFKGNVPEIVADISTESNDIVSLDSPTEKPEKRTPKFLLGLLSFGNGDKPPVGSVESTIKTEDSSEKETLINTNVAQTEELFSMKVSESTNAEELMEASGLAEPISLEPRVVENFMGFESTSSEIDTQSAEKFEKTPAILIQVTTIKPEPSFTSEQLKEFCISLLSRVQVSPKSVAQFSEEDGSGQLEMMDKETVTEFQLLTTDVPKEVTTKSTNQRFGIWASIWNRLVGRSLMQDPIDVNLQSSTTKHDIRLGQGKESANNEFSLRSESSTVLDVADSSESAEDFNEDDGSALTVPDCESFFRHIQNDAVFAKPNLLDIINNPSLLSLNPSQLNFTEMRDKQMRSMKSGSDMKDSSFEKDALFTKEMMNIPNTPSFSVESTSEDFSEFSVNEMSSEHPDKNLLENTVLNQDLSSTSNSFDTQESFQIGKLDKSNIDHLSTGKDSRKSVTETAFLSDEFTTLKFQSFAGILDDGLLVQSEAHTRTDESSEMASSEVSADIDGRIFGLINFGSGERSLDDSEILTTQNLSEIPENRSFYPDLVNFASGDSELNEKILVNEQEIASTDAVTGINIFDNILNLRKDESPTNNKESDTFSINDEDKSNEVEGTITSEKPSIELQFDQQEKSIESQNVLDPTNVPTTQSVSDDQTLLPHIFDEKQRIEFQFDHKEKFTESQNVASDSTNIPEMKSSLEDQTAFQTSLDEETRVFPGLLNILGSGDGRELSEIPSDPELGSEFSVCLDCLKNKSGSFPVDDHDDRASDTNETDEKSTENHPLSNKIATDAYAYDANYFSTKVEAFSDSNPDPAEFSTLHSPQSFISPVTETIGYEPYDNSENDDYGATNYEYYDNSKNIGHEMTNYEYYDNSKNIGHEMTNYEYFDNSKNNDHEINYEHQDNYEYYDNSKNIGYETTNYEYYNSKNIGHEINYEYQDNSEDYGIAALQPMEHVHIEGECTEIHPDIKTEASSASPTEAKIAPEDLRFMDTLFLTGSGAGGLFGNDDGEINFVQELDTTSFPSPLPVSPRQSRRGGRMDDGFFTARPQEKDRVSDITRPQSTSDNPKLNPQDITMDEAIQMPEVKGFSTDSISPFSTRIVQDGSNDPNINEGVIQTFQAASSEAVTTLSTPTNSFVVPKKKAKDLPPRYCNHAGECNVVLNEGCITKKGHGVCDCRRSFVRHPETDVCEAPFMLKTSLKLPAEVFHEDLRDERSELYRNKTRDAIDTMWLVVYQDPTLEYNLADIDVAGFEEGSLVIHWRLTFAVTKNENISEIVQEVDEKLEETFHRQAVLKSAPLNVENAKLLSYSDINPCEKKELNYCSKNADCIRETYRGFRCRCKDGYMDNSKNPLYPGEICIATCPQDYCGENGYCELRSNGEKHCLCNGWYFGEKCNVSGILVVSCFGAANVVLIVVVLAIVFICKRRRQRGTRFYENNQIMGQPNRESSLLGRISPRLASINLDEFGPTKTSKYSVISTPVYIKPDIQITSPSIMGSSISYEYDSTFDRTPSAEVSMEPPKYDSVPEASKV